MTINEFLLARIEEDEAVARECLEPKNLVPYGDERIPAIKPEEWGDLVENYLGGPMGTHCARHDPARVLAECAAKRAIIQSYGACQYAEDEALKSDSRALEAFGVKLVSSGMVKGLELAVKHLAAVYASHPEYQREWAK